MVRGWWKQPEGLYVLHAVIRRAGVHVCFTPMVKTLPAVFDFAPDPAIRWLGQSATRAGQPVPSFARAYCYRPSFSRVPY